MLATLTPPADVPAIAIETYATHVFERWKLDARASTTVC
jgi:uncharacterized membrane protein YgcG